MSRYTLIVLLFVGTSGCFKSHNGEPLEGGTGDASLDSGTDAAPTDSATPRSCAAIQAEYERLLANTSCTDRRDCGLIIGHCDLGLGGCLHALNGVSQPQVDALVLEWLAAGCEAGAPVCDCATFIGGTTCRSGMCVLQPI